MSSQALRSSACPACGNTTVTLVREVNGYRLARCQTCGLVHVNPTPGDAEIEAHYQDPRYFSGNEGQGYLHYEDTEKALLPHFNRRLDVIESHLHHRGKLLDVGCAAGFFLRQAQSRGWRIFGVELSRDMAHHAAESLHAPVATSLQSLGEKDFDAITLWEVIEHLTQPISFLQDLRDHLRDGGMLMLSTPNNGHWQAIREPHQWEAYRPPAHLLYFTQATLQDVLHRAGFEHITVNKTSPLPPLPGPVRQWTQPLQRSLARGQAKAWALSLYTWRAIRVLGWGWQRVAHRSDDIYSSLEAYAFRPSA